MPNQPKQLRVDTAPEYRVSMLVHHRAIKSSMKRELLGNKIANKIEEIPDVSSVLVQEIPKDQPFRRCGQHNYCIVGNEFIAIAINEHNRTDVKHFIADTKDGKSEKNAIKLAQAWADEIYRAKGQ